MAGIRIQVHKPKEFHDIILCTLKLMRCDESGKASVMFATQHGHASDDCVENGRGMRPSGLGQLGDEIYSETSRPARVDDRSAF
jgi:hypothetical protein